MREIKFRAWDGKRFLYRGLHDRNWYATPYNDENGCNCVRGCMPNDCLMTIEQFTGLKDKNGKEIYEGDKLKVVNHSILIGDGTSNMSCETRVYEIVFHEHEFVGKLIEYGIPHLKIVENYDPIYHDLIGMMDDIEIIGNIHEVKE